MTSCVSGPAATCGGKFTICEATKYGCSTWRTRGGSVCTNSLRVERTLVESKLLASIQRDLFTEECLVIFKQEVLRLLAEQRRTRTPDIAAARARLRAVELEHANIMTAIRAGARIQASH
jgi:hypothetical protein